MSSAERPDRVAEGPESLTALPRTKEELDALLEQSRQAGRLEGALLAARAAAHSLNNVLAPITGFAELLTRNPAVRSNLQAETYAKLIFKQAQDAAAAVKQLNQVQRVEETPTTEGSPVMMLDLERSSGETR
jgi:nitrogen-specific signal transduction histidine kinase